MASPDQTSAQQLWLEAGRDRKIARLLHLALVDPTLSRILLLHREELFPRLTSTVRGGPTFLFGSSSFVLPSHPVDHILRSIRTLNKKQLVHSYPAARREDTSTAVRELDETTRQTLLDNLAIEVLKVIQDSSSLRELINQPNPILFGDFKRAVGDPSQFKLDGFINALTTMFQRVLSGTRSKETLDQLALEVDSLKDFVDVDQIRIILLQTGLAHYRRLVKALRISERLWRDALLSLHRDCFLEHSGPLYLWCIRCPESGVLANVRSTELLKPFRCPRCGRRAWSATTLLPSDSLNTAIRLRDGMLGAAIGWQLCRRRIPFHHSVMMAGTEIDFLVGRGSENILIEAKMNHQLKSRDAMTSALRANLRQLSAHVRAAQSKGISISSAVCVVNHPRTLLRQLQWATGSPNSTVAEELLSYQDLDRWISRTLIGKK